LGGDCGVEGRGECHFYLVVYDAFVKRVLRMRLNAPLGDKTLEYTSCSTDRLDSPSKHRVVIHIKVDWSHRVRVSHVRHIVEVDSIEANLGDSIELAL
jgi:hypothetical protein